MHNGFLDMCDCTIDYGVDDEDEIGWSGEATKMNYQGGGVYICPKCNEKVDHSEDTYKIKVKIEMDEEYKCLRIIEGEERINHKFDDDDEHSCGIKDSIEETLNDSAYIHKWLEDHELGVFDIEVYYHNYSYWTDCGTEYDLDVEILKEVEAK